MELNEILAQPEGFTPPSATVKIKKVWPRKSGTNDNGEWSFQNIEVEGGRLKLKSLPEFPKAREGQLVTLRANQSKQHGLTGIKVNHEQYNGSTYHQLVITNSCKWEWGTPSTNGSTASQSNPATSDLGIEGYIAHLHACAALTNEIIEVLKLTEDQAIQACFATICIDTKNRAVVLPKPAPVAVAPAPDSTEQGDPYENSTPADYDPAYDDGVPF